MLSSEEKSRTRRAVWETMACVPSTKLVLRKKACFKQIFVQDRHGGSLQYRNDGSVEKFLLTNSCHARRFEVLGVQYLSGGYSCKASIEGHYLNSKLCKIPHTTFARYRFGGSDALARYSVLWLLALMVE